MSTLEIEIRPRKHFRAYIERTQRWACLVVHRRGGKTFVCIQDVLMRAMTHTRLGPPLRYAYVAPTRDQAKDVAWGYLSRYCSPIPGAKLNQADLIVTLPNQATIRLYSGESYERMRGLYFDGVIIDEAADIDPAAWDSVIRPTLSDYTGWATFIGTAKGRNSFFERYRWAVAHPEDWFSMRLPQSQSGIIPEQEYRDLTRDMTAAAVAQEYECDFSIGRPGAIYVKALDDALKTQRISDNVMWFAQVPVYTTFDVGAGANQRVWIWQLVGDRINFLEALSGGDDVKTPSDWADVLRRKQYSYGSHFIPHDAAAENGGLWQSALGEAGLSHVVPVPRQLWIWDGINAALDNFPRCYFADTACKDGLKALEHYYAKQERDGITIKDVPVHDWSSHFADAFSLAHQAIRAGLVIDRSAIPRKPRLHGQARVLMGIGGSEVKRRPLREIDYL